MGITVGSHLRPSAHRLLGGSLLLGAAITVAACGSSATTGSGSGSSPGAGSAASAGTSSSSAVSLSTKSVPGVGTVLVDGQGRTLYLLTSEKGGKVTCTPSNGCTKFWPEITLPKGATAATAGTGVQSSLLGTVKDASGNLEVTYNGWPVANVGLFGYQESLAVPYAGMSLVVEFAGAALLGAAAAIVLASRLWRRPLVYSRRVWPPEA